jgi:hypothetical protein
MLNESSFSFALHVIGSASISKTISWSFSSILLTHPHTGKELQNHICKEMLSTTSLKKFISIYSGDTL